MRCRNCGEMLDSTGRCFLCRTKSFCGFMMDGSNTSNNVSYEHRPWHEAVVDADSSYNNLIDDRMGELGWRLT